MVHNIRYMLFFIGQYQVEERWFVVAPDTGWRFDVLKKKAITDCLDKLSLFALLAVIC